jgi:hypothetical protein
MSRRFHNKHRPKRSDAATAPPRSETQKPAPHKDNQGPEWTTERWMHRVEAEARTRLKHEVRDVGALRR